MPQTKTKLHDDIEDEKEAMPDLYHESEGEDHNLLPNKEQASNAIKIPFPNIPVGFVPRDTLQTQTYSKKLPVSGQPTKRKPALDPAVRRGSPRVQKTSKDNPKQEEQVILSDEDIRSEAESYRRDGAVERKMDRSNHFTRQSRGGLGSTMTSSAQRTFEIPKDKLPPKMQLQSKDSTQKRQASNSEDDDDLEIVGRRPVKLTHALDQDDVLTPTELLLRTPKSQVSLTSSKAVSATDSIQSLYLREFRRGLFVSSKSGLVFSVDKNGDFQLTYQNREAPEGAFNESEIQRLHISECRDRMAIELKHKGPRRNDKPKHHLIHIIMQSIPDEKDIGRMFRGRSFKTERDAFFVKFVRSLCSVVTEVIEETRPVGGQATRPTNQGESMAPKSFYTKSAVPTKRQIVEITPGECYGKPNKDSKKAKRATQSTTSSTSGMTQKWVDSLTNLPPWKTPLIYPLTGKSRATIDYIDLDRLNDGEFLNDNIINFYLKYLEVNLNVRDPDIAKKCHFFNTFFFGNLSRRTADKKRDFSRVMKWTAGIDLFQKDFIFVPINENMHWYLAIICNLPHIHKKIEDSLNNDNSREYVDEDNGDDIGENLSEGFPNQFSTQMQIDSDLNTTSETEQTLTLRDMTIIRQVQQAQLDYTDDAEASFEQMSIDEERRSLDIQGNDDSKVDVMSISSINTVPGSSMETDCDTSPLLSVKKTKIKTKSRRLKRAPKIYDSDTPAIFILDSLGARVHRNTFIVLREYLREEAKNKKHMEIPATKEAIIGSYPPDVPSQSNFCDCGLYLLYYVKRFIERPAEFTEEFLRKEKGSHHFIDTDIQSMRIRLRKLIIRLKHEQDTAEISAGERHTVQEDSDDDSIEILESTTSENKFRIEEGTSKEAGQASPIESAQTGDEITNRQEQPTVVLESESMVSDAASSDQPHGEEPSTQLARRDIRASVGSGFSGFLQKQNSQISSAIPSSPSAKRQAAIVHEVLDSPPPGLTPEHRVLRGMEQSKTIVGPDEVYSISDDDPDAAVIRESSFSGVPTGRVFYRKPKSKTVSTPELEDELQDFRLQLQVRQEYEQQQQSAEEPRSRCCKGKGKIKAMETVPQRHAPSPVLTDIGKPKSEGSSDGETKPGLFSQWKCEAI